MKRIFILLLVCGLSKIVAAQEELGDCIRRSFINTDSLLKAGNNPFEDWKQCVIGKPIPAFSVKNIDGDSIRMSDIKGKVLVLNFWSIDCHPCIAEMPGMNKLVDEYKKKDVVFLALTWETVKRIYDDFFPKFKFDFIIVPDVMPVINKIWGSGFPTTYIIDKQGIIRNAWNGGSTGEKAGKEYYEKAKEVIDKLLKADASASLSTGSTDNDSRTER